MTVGRVWSARACFLDAFWDDFSIAFCMEFGLQPQKKRMLRMYNGMEWHHVIPDRKATVGLWHRPITEGPMRTTQRDPKQARNRNNKLKQGSNNENKMSTWVLHHRKLNQITMQNQSTKNFIFNMQWNVTFKGCSNVLYFALELIPGNSTGTPIFIKNEPENVNTKAVGDVKQAVNKV